MRDPKIWRIEAFAEGSLQGNPAGVVLLPTDGAWPDDNALQSLAKDIGFSETAYVRPQSDGKLQLRWFTPAVEVDLCGHATLAAAFALWESDAASRHPVTFTTKSGDLTITRNDSNGQITLDFPADTPVHDTTSASLRAPLAAALGIDVSVIADCFSGRLDTVVVVSDELIVFKCTPDFTAIRAMDTRGVILTAPSAGESVADFTSRFFAPKCGVPEDPVTGSTHCVLGPYWAEQLKKQTLTAYQASERGGLLHLQVTPGSDRILISGLARFIGE